MSREVTESLETLDVRDCLSAQQFFPTASRIMSMSGRLLLVVRDSIPC